MENEKILRDILDRLEALEGKIDNLTKDMKEEPEEKINVGKKYRFLADYLNDSEKATVRLTFKKMEELIHGKLPSSAYNHRAFWANTESHSIALSWMSVGYKTVDVNIEDEFVVFEKIRSY